MKKNKPSKIEIEKKLGDWKPVSESRIQEVRKRNELIKIKKDAKFTARLSQVDFDGLKRLAEKKGIPYQTLLGSIIHEYVSGSLVDIEEIRKVFPQIKLKKGA